MATKPKHVHWKEHIYEGITLTGIHPVETMDCLKDFELSGDILVASYPRTGTTWTQELTWLILTEGDFDLALSQTIDERVPWLEFKLDGMPSGMEIAENLPHPRLIKTHMPAKLFTNQLSKFDFKVIVVIRNPKDTLVAMYEVYRAHAGLGNYTGTWDEFFEDIIKTKRAYCGDYFQWYMSWLAYKDDPNVKLVRYEDLSKNLESVICDLAQFLGKHVSREVMERMLKHLTFSGMKENKMTNKEWASIENNGVWDFTVTPFMRKGKIGDWINYFSLEQSEYIDSQYRASLQKAGVSLEFE